LQVSADYVAKLAEIGPILDQLARPLRGEKTERIQGLTT
jgi:hypothetical protein